MANAGLMMDNRRKFVRSQADVMVTMTHPSLGTLNVKAKDLSEGGIAVDMGIHPAPPPGTELDVIIKRHTGALNHEPVKMQVVHVNKQSVGLKFV